MYENWSNACRDSSDLSERSKFWDLNDYSILSSSDSMYFRNSYESSALDFSMTSENTNATSTLLDMSTTPTATFLQTQNSDFSDLPPHHLRVSPLPTESTISSEDIFSSQYLEELTTATDSVDMYSSCFTNQRPIAYDESRSSVLSFSMPSDLESMKCSTPDTLRVSSIYSEIVEDCTNLPTFTDMSSTTSKKTSEVDENGNVNKKTTEFREYTEEARQSSPLSTMNSISSLPTDTVTINVAFDSSTNGKSEFEIPDKKDDSPFKLYSSANPSDEPFPPFPLHVAELSHDDHSATIDSAFDSCPDSPVYTESCTLTPPCTEIITPYSTNPTSTPIPSPIPTELLITQPCKSNVTHSTCSSLAASSSNCVFDMLQQLTLESETKLKCLFNSLGNTKQSHVSSISNKKGTSEQCLHTNELSYNTEYYVDEDMKKVSVTQLLDRKLQSSPERRPPFWKPFPAKNDEPKFVKEYVSKNKKQTKGTTETQISKVVILNQEEEAHILRNKVNNKGMNEDYTRLTKPNNFIAQDTPPPVRQKENVLPFYQQAYSKEKGKSTSNFPKDRVNSVNETKRTNSPSPPPPPRPPPMRIELPPPLPPPPAEDSIIPTYPPPVPSLPHILSMEQLPIPPVRRYLLIPLSPNHISPASTPPPTPKRSSSFAKVSPPTPRIHSNQHISLEGEIVQELNSNESDLNQRILTKPQCPKQNYPTNGTLFCGSRSRINSLTPVPEEQIISPNSSPLPPIIANEPLTNWKEEIVLSTSSPVEPICSPVFPPPPTISPPPLYGAAASPPHDDPIATSIPEYASPPPIPPPPLEHIQFNTPPIPSHPKSLHSSPKLPPPPPPRVCSLPTSPLLKNGVSQSTSNVFSYQAKLSSTDLNCRTPPGAQLTMSSPNKSTEERPAFPPPPPPPALPTVMDHPSAQMASLISVFPYGKLVVDRSDLPMPPAEEEVRKALRNAVNWGWLLPQMNTLSIYTQIKPIIQKGPQCGIVALSMASEICSGTSVHPDILLKEAQIKGISNHGEMFSAEDFAQLAKDCVEGIDVSVKEDVLSNPQGVIELLLQGNLILVPYDSEHNHMPCEKSGHKAHWALLCGALIQSDTLSTNPELCQGQPDIKVDNLWHLKPRHETTNILEGRSQNPLPHRSWMEDITNLVLLWRQGKSRGLISSPLEIFKRSNEQLIEYPESEDYVIKSVKDGLAGKVVSLRGTKSTLSALLGSLQRKEN